MAKYYIWTIGCQMNKAESERLGSHLEGLGYQATATAEEADFILLNSCVVRQSAEDRVINKLNSLKALKAKRRNLILALTGCLVDCQTSELKSAFPHVDYFFKPGSCPECLGEQETGAKSCLAFPRHPTPSVFVPIIQGCNNFCAYCIVPYRRGREVSRPMTEVVDEVKELARSGAKEVILLGQNVDAYGHDLPGSPDLADLLRELNNIDDLSRIRFLTNHPAHMSRKLIEAAACLDKVCGQICLPVQSGDDDVLKAMKRDYTVAQYRQLVGEIRSKIPNVAVSTDVIVGFPAETEQQFQNTISLLAELRFDTVHVAAYSPRPGTFAANELRDDVPPAAKKERLNKVEQLQEKIAGEINSRLLGQTTEVLVERKKRGKWQGRARSDKLVFFSESGDFTGQLVDIRIEKTSPWSLQGKMETTSS